MWRLNNSVYLHNLFRHKLYLHHLQMLFQADIKRTIARSFLVVFTLMLLNGVVFRHSHKLSSGKIITHAHPYKPVGNVPYQPNNHTTNELYVLDLVSNAHFVHNPVFGFVALVSVVIISQKVSFFQYQQRFLTRSVARLLLRGPPILS